MKKTISIQVYGLVQGVGFRYTTKMLADKIGIKGMVRNEMDGSVFIKAQGEPMKLQEFLSGVKASPSPMGRVDKVTVNNIPNENFNTFDVDYYS